MSTIPARFKDDQAYSGSTYRSLYLIGGAAAALEVVLTVLHSGVFFVVELPGSVVE
jgi:hypothetical protein